jgi:transcriptional regulator with XRE-family HTH domain
MTRATNNLSGKLLCKWRKARHVSQLELALMSQTSQRHLSFVETGRAQAGREMILKLSEALDVPLRARNEILLAAGYAPYFPERALAVADMVIVNRLLERMLAHHNPYPATVLDGTWNIVMRNEAASRIINSCVPGRALARISIQGKLNFMRLMFAKDGLRPHIRSWPQTSRVLLARLRREAAYYPGSPSETLLHELAESDDLPGFVEIGDAPLESTIPITIEVNGQMLTLLNTLTTFGTPQDVTLQELRIEMSFPADDATERLLRRR